MARRNVSLPDDLDGRARDEGLNVSALTQQAIVGELDRRRRMAQLDAWLDELDGEHGSPSAAAMAEGEAWAQSAVAATGKRRAKATKNAKPTTKAARSSKAPGSVVAAGRSGTAGRVLGR